MMPKATSTQQLLNNLQQLRGKLALFNESSYNACTHFRGQRSVTHVKVHRRRSSSRAVLHLQRAYWLPNAGPNAHSIDVTPLCPTDVPTLHVHAPRSVRIPEYLHVKHYRYAAEPLHV